MNKYYPSLEEAIRMKIRTRVFICIGVFILALVVTIGFYLYYFIDQVEKKLDVVAMDLTPYILSQELIGSKKAVEYKLKQVALQNKMQVVWHKGEESEREGFFLHHIIHWQKYVPVVSLDNRYFGYYVMSGSVLQNDVVVNAIYFQMMLVFLFSLVVLFLLWPIAKSIPESLFVVPINRLLKLLKSDEDESTEFDAPYEIVKLRDEMRLILKNKKEVLQKTALLSLAQQVAHDIRSPLQAIITSVKLNKKLPEKFRVTVTTASNRINDIANNLLTQYQFFETSNQTEPPVEDNAKEMIFFLLDSILSEKRSEYIESQIIINFSHADIGTSFVVLNKGKFKRVISNIINNAVEAVSNDGVINVSLDATKDEVIIVVEDNGCGVSKQDLANIKEEGVSQGKDGGVGIGLTMADQYIQKIGGSLGIDSIVGKGTTVTIKMPRSTEAFWFCSEIEIQESGTIVIADDDRSIHDIWRGRLDESKYEKIIDIYSPKKFREYIDTYGDDAKFLIDYEFVGSNLSGLELIKKYKLIHKAYLVTSKVENEKLRFAAQRAGIKIIPKPFVFYIPIHYTAKTPGETVYVFLDDNLTLRTAWQLAATNAKVTLKCFADTAACRSELSNFPKETIFYLDSNLGERMSGEMFAKELFDAGYRNMYLATGYANKNYDECIWLKGVVDKEPPF